MYNSFLFQSNRHVKQDSNLNVEHIQRLFDANMVFFSRELPELYQTLTNCNSKNYSLFINASGALNIRDNSSGEALYSKTPATEVTNEVEFFLGTPLAVCRDSTSINAEVSAIPDRAVVMVFGVGCGYHLKQLLLSDKLSAILIYEADVELLKHSLNFIVWQDLLEIANKKNVLLAIQPGYAVADIKQHLAELDAAGLFTDKIYLYRHTFQPLAEEVIRFLLASSGDSTMLLQGEGRFLGLKGAHEYLPVRPAGILGNVEPNFKITEKHQLTLHRNLEKLQVFYPDIAAFYQYYQPQRWQFCIDNNGQENIFHLPSRTLAYHNSKQESEALAQLFMQNPFRESAVYSQSYQPKLAKYIHFQQIALVENLQKLLPIAPAFCKDDIRTLAFFGTGLAGHIASILAEITPLNIFVFEEDPDLFYASLYVTDWAELIEQSNTSKGHLYFNIGCTPDSYLSYFLYQIYVVGAYEISNTFLFPCYYRPHLQKALADLRAQLKTFIALNEYYDNARYGITHFLRNAENAALFYREQPQQKHADCPVFIIGNGPSLDALIEYIRQYQNDVIIISCGTALKALYEYGITPDFHAEVEQNSATYKWITKVPDRAYLKSIHFLSVATAFPETAKLFKSACLSFCFGQTPFKVLTLADETSAKQMRLLKYAFPTVSNFAINMALSMGFQDIYLFGVDLGFADVAHHHSKKSAYYTAQGKATYDYAKRIGQQIPVKGNFTPYVYTKFEFNMARRVMEQVIASYRNSSQVYNCSLGAFIDGAIPLPAEHILIKAQTEHKNKVLTQLLSVNFAVLPEPSIIAFKDYLTEHLPDVTVFITALLALMPKSTSSESEASALVAKQASLLHAQYTDNNLLACYLLEGSIYSFLGLMNSFASVLDETTSFDLFNQLTKVWQDYLELVRNRSQFTC
ncbi:motility associated factor glycosyltransferase family protein [Alishewanella longhuensis]